MKKIIYVPSYCLAKKYPPARLTDMSLQTAKKGLEMMKSGLGDVLVMSTAHEQNWKIEASIKSGMAKNCGVSVKIIPATTDSFDEAVKLRRMVTEIFGNDDVEMIAVCQKYHTNRVVKSLKPFFKNVKGVRVETKIERQLDPSMVKGFLCTATKLNFILWQVFFGLIGPLMMRRQIRKNKKR